MGNLCKRKKKPPSQTKVVKDMNSSNSILLNISNKQPIVNNFINQNDTSKNNNSSSFQHRETRNLSTMDKYPSLKKTVTNCTNSISINYKTFIKAKNYTDLLHDYELLDNLGAGAFGVVQKVRHKASKQIRAMKTIKKNSLNEEKSLKEIDNLMLLDHPNILKLYEYYFDKKNLYIITEYCEGGELFDKIKDRDGYFSERDAATIIKAVLHAIAYCHSVGLVHRDLKPENILLEGDELDHIKLIDFGTSNLINPNQKLKERLGTAYYIAPEVLRKNYDEKCDLWSIGVIMFILLTGEPPFNGNTDEEILENVRNGYVDFSTSIFQEISEEAKDLLSKLLEKNPSKRISAVEALEHPWITNLAPNAKLNKGVCQKVFSNLKTFQADQKLQEAAIAFITNQLVSKEETEELRKIFIELDANCDGVLSREEIECGLVKYYGGDKAKQETDAIFEKVDADQNGFISYDEFIRASIDKNKILTEEKLRAAFKLFDKNGDGTIEAKEIKEVLGKDLNNDNEEVWNNVVKEVDQNGDGEISYEEFKLMMEKICISS